jgi:hypothetical protein
VRFKKLDDLALDVIGETIKRVPAKKYIEICEAAMKATGRSATKGTRKGGQPAKPKKSAKRA